jgi:broad specificity phosphatase PhoE
MPKLVLIKHSLPEVRPADTPSTWPLSEEGRRHCQPLADALRPLGLARVFASPEPKASETGWLLAQDLGLPFAIKNGLHEHERDREPFEEDRTRFEARVRSLFERPRERTFGSESGGEALLRFQAAVSGILAEHPSEDLAIVAHGSVNGLFAAAKCSIDGFQVWTRWGSPSYVVLTVPGFDLVEIVDNVAS